MDTPLATQRAQRMFLHSNRQASVPAAVALLRLDVLMQLKICNYNIQNILMRTTTQILDHRTAVLDKPGCTSTLVQWALFKHVVFLEWTLCISCRSHSLMSISRRSPRICKRFLLRLLPTTLWDAPFPSSSLSCSVIPYGRSVRKYLEYIFYSF